MTTQQANDFLADYEALCKKHNITIALSLEDLILTQLDSEPEALEQIKNADYWNTDLDSWNSGMQPNVRE